MINKFPSRILVMCTVTNDCNQVCKHCVTNARSCRKELELRIIEEMISDLKLLGVEHLVSFVGGEATIWSGFFSMLGSEWFASIKNKMLYTNATALDDEKINKICESNFFEVRVSVDSDKKEEHDDLRGNGTFEKTISTMQKMIEKDIPVTTATVIKKNNIDKLDKIITFLKEKGVCSIHLLPFFLNGRGELQKKYVCEEAYIEQTMEQIKNKFNRYVYDNNSLCKNGTAYFKINFDGQCILQQDRDKKILGNLYEESFFDLYKKALNMFEYENINCSRCNNYNNPRECRNMHKYCKFDLFLNGKQD